jgi:mono/diheme cytochrome c family protein
MSPLPSRPSPRAWHPLRPVRTLALGPELDGGMAASSCKADMVRQPALRMKQLFAPQRIVAVGRQCWYGVIRDGIFIWLQGTEMSPEKLLVLAAGALLAGCANEMDDSVSVERGAQFFAANCAACHGADARGYDGPQRDWTVPPPDLTHLSQRNGGTFPEIETLATVYGPAYHSRLGSIMPEFGELELGPLVIVEVEEGIGTPIPVELVALSEYLKSIQR